jgi:hypothetical protein
MTSWWAGLSTDPISDVVCTATTSGAGGRVYHKPADQAADTAEAGEAESRERGGRTVHDLLPLSSVQVGCVFINICDCNGPLNVDVPLDLRRWNRRRNTW